MGRSPGTAWGDDAVELRADLLPPREFGVLSESVVAPAATTESKDTPSAPASRKLRSIHQASSRSVLPVKRSWASAAKISSDSALAPRIEAISDSSFTARNDSTSPDDGTASTPASASTRYPA
ncbi:MAG: hypothetical protein HW413_1738 [Thermoleophilia bacterium]|nr:hypothetical protein [Thermoleophilia bacterium]